MSFRKRDEDLLPDFERMSTDEKITYLLALLQDESAKSLSVPMPPQYLTMPMDAAVNRDIEIRFRSYGEQISVPKTILTDPV